MNIVGQELDNAVGRSVCGQGFDPRVNDTVDAKE